jgi:hypothetical protein
MTTYTYCDDIFSDLHKDVYGMRPRAGGMLAEWNSWTPQQKQQHWDYLCAQLEVNEKAARKHEEEMLVEFRQTLRRTMNACTCNWSDAIRILADAENLNASVDYDLEHFLWGTGIGWDANRKIKKMYREAIV